MKQKGYLDFCEYFYPNLINSRRGLFGVEWEITYRCNFNCLHCYLPLNIRKQDEKELDIVGIEKILNKLSKFGVLWIIFSGGEPFLREDFPDILELAHKKGFFIGVNSNGSLISDRIIQKFKNYPPLVIDIPIYGGRPETHDKFTQIPGSFTKTIENIQKLQSLGEYPIILLKGILNIYNKNEIKEMRAIAKKLNLPFRYNPYIYARLNGDLTPCELRVSPDEAVEIERDDIEVQNVFRKKFFNKELRYKNGKYVGCGVGKDFFVIDPYGNIRPCAQMPGPKYSILNKKKLNHIWREIQQYVERVWRYTDSKCGDCPVSYLCANCPARSFTETGKISHPVDYFCNLAYIRYKKIIEEAKGEKKETLSKADGSKN
jgi:radical SAM protein with 4Fe4S-binding SPASM domain